MRQTIILYSIVIALLLFCLPQKLSGNAIAPSIGSTSTYTQQDTSTIKTPASPPIEPIKHNEIPPFSKKGWNFAPLPAVGYSSDLGLQLGVILDVHYFGDGSIYPDYLHKITAEACYFTKGSGIYYLFYDSKYLIKGLRLTATASYLPSTMMAFYGFNGFESPYLRDKNDGFYAIERNILRIIASLQGTIYGHWGWAAGMAYYNYDTGRIKVNKYDGETTLYDIYRKYNIIEENEENGGSHIELRAGIAYDSRDNEPDPSKGIYADIILYGSPDIIEQKGYNYLKAGIAFRHYVSLIKDRLTLAYRVCWQGTIAGKQPYYVAQNYAAILPKQINSDILGGAISLRGVLYNRILGDAMAWANVELRLRLISFKLIGQEWYITTNPFFDAGMATKPFRRNEIKEAYNNLSIPLEVRNSIYSGDTETLHMSAGLGFKLVMNRNFVLSAEYGIPFDKRDGDNGLYLSINYIF